MAETPSAPILPTAAPPPPVAPDRSRATLRCIYAALLAAVLSALPGTREKGSAEDTSAPVPGVMPRTGSLVIAGGGKLPQEIHSRFLELAGGEHANICVVPTASEEADRPGGDDIDFFKRRWGLMPTASAQIFHTRNPVLADDRAFTRPLDTATGAWLSIGDQDKLAKAYRGTRVERQLRRILDRGGVVGGTSAGAAAMSERMIIGGDAAPKMGTGFGFVPKNWIVDQHFMNRDRLHRLLGAIGDDPDALGVGVDEGTALIVTLPPPDRAQDYACTVLGTGNVRICEAQGKIRVLKAGDTVTLKGIAARKTQHAQIP